MRCWFDTGNSGLAMSLELAEQLNLNPVGVFSVSGLGFYATEVVRAGPLQIGSVRFGDAEYVVLSDIHRYGYDLVLGADVFAATPLTIDYGRHTIAFTNSRSARISLEHAGPSGVILTAPVISYVSGPNSASLPLRDSTNQELPTL